MKKNKLISLICLIALFVVSAVCTAFAIADSAKYTWSEVSLSNSYYVGDVLTVPTASVNDGESDYDAEFSIVYPDGKTYADDDSDLSTPSQFELDRSGEYKLVYTAIVKGKAVVKEVKFSVTEKLFSVSSANSSIEYGEFSYNYPDSEETRSRTGLKVSLASGDTFKYNKVVELDKMPTLAKIVEFYAIPETDRELDVSGLTLILTDAYDRTNSVEIKIKALINAKNQSWWDYTYLSACVPSIGQVTTGHAKGAKPPVQVDTIYGAGRYFSFYGSTFDKKGSALDRSLPVYYNNSEKAVYVGDTLVVDLDDPYFFSKLWSGFTSDKVYVSIVGNTYYKDSANIIISELCEQDLAEANTLSKNTVPNFYVDSQGVDIDTAVTVLGYKFPVFDVTAVDVYDGVLPVSVKAFNGYYSSSKTELDIVDGAFVADMLGVVTLEYTATAHDGRTFKKLIDVNVKSDKIISVEFLTKDQTGVAGTIFDIADYNIFNNVGNAKAQVSVTLNGNPVNIENGAFKAISSGEYIVKVNIEDLIGQTAEDSYVVTVDKNLNPVFFGDVIIPKYFIIDREYKLPKFNAYDYSDNIEKEISSVIKVNGKECNSYTAKEEGEVVVEYVATTAKGESTKTYNAKAISVKRDATSINYVKYFDTQSFKVTADSSGMNLFVRAGNENANATFINYLTANEFSIEFAINPERKAFSKLQFALCDVLDDANKIIVEVDPTTLKTYVNGQLMDTVLDSKVLFNTNGKASIKLSFDDRTDTVSIGSGSFVVPEFKSFSSNLIALDISATQVEESEIFIRKICNQVLKSTIKKDNIDPQVSYDGTYDIYSEIGKEQKVYRAVITDVLNPVIESYVSVTAPDGNFVTAKDGTLLDKVDADVDYAFIMSVYGTYTIQYYAKDTAGNVESSMRSNVTVIDKEPPVLEFDGKVPTSAQFGSVVKLPGIIATDNVDTELTTTVILYNSYTGFRKLLKENEFTITEIGEYQVTFVCYDTAGNACSKSFTVKVVV